MRKFLVTLVLLSLPALTEAQEKVVPLKRGMTVWGILKSGGCSSSQIDRIWRVVVADSGLDPARQRRLEPNIPIVIKRDCDGNPLETLTLENKKLKDLLDAVTLERDNLYVTAARQNLEPVSQPSSSYIWQVIVALLLAAVACLGVVVYSVVYVQRAKILNDKAGGVLERNAVLLQDRDEEIRALKYSLREVEKTLSEVLVLKNGHLDFPPEVVAGEWGQEHTFSRKYDLVAGRIGYVCPGCGSLISQHKVRDHWKQKHAGELDRVIFEVQEPIAV